jgi:hypothetical protein
MEQSVFNVYGCGRPELDEYCSNVKYDFKEVLENVGEPFETGEKINIWTRESKRCK